MKVSDYIADFLISIGVTDCFGYPGGSVTNLLDSIHKREDKIKAHVTYHEQGAAFAACGYAETSGRVGVAYSTGGPGCTNMITGIGQAYCDSIPVIFLTGNVNTYEMKGNLHIRQRGFQEADNVSVATPFTKYAACVDKPEMIKYHLEKAYYYATSGRKGPVLLDLPMDIQRAQIDPEELIGYEDSLRNNSGFDSCIDFTKVIKEELEKSKRPCFVLGNGIRNPETKKYLGEILLKYNLPYVTSMISFDVLGSHPNYYGFLGAYGDRTANFIVAKSDLIISIGSRLDIRQVGAKREDFAPESKIIRVDIDRNELEYKVHDDEIGFCLDASIAVKEIYNTVINNHFSNWLNICNIIRSELKDLDVNDPNRFLQQLGDSLPSSAVITTDVGQNQVWVAQSLKLKEDQQVLFSGGFGSMGYALPAAIGAYYGLERKNVIAICGDGGFQMNIQELQYVVRERLPIKIIVFNNNALGMIRHFQEMYFDSVYYQTKPEGGYTSPDFTQIAQSYGIRALAINSIDEMQDMSVLLNDDKPILLEIRYFDNTYIIPKLKFGNPNQDQEPLIDRTLFEKLMNL